MKKEDPFIDDAKSEMDRKYDCLKVTSVIISLLAVLSVSWCFFLMLVHSILNMKEHQSIIQVSIESFVTFLRKIYEDGCVYYGEKKWG